jgi:hypothetical protein
MNDRHFSDRQKFLSLKMFFKNNTQLNGWGLFIIHPQEEMSQICQEGEKGKIESIFRIHLFYSGDFLQERIF